MQTKQAMKSADRADNSLKHSKYNRSGQGIDSSRKQNKPQKTQTEQMTHQGMINRDGVEEALDNAKKVQTIDINGMSHKKRI